jgi:hypothetical protein
VTRQLIKCKYENCDNQLKIEVNSDSCPIAFCSERCLNKFENMKFNYALDREDPNDVRSLVQQLVSQTKQLQSELENLKKIRKTYFGIFTESNLKDETYKRDWAFEKPADE